MTGTTIWDASRALAEYIESNAERFANAVAVELGAGCGVAGLALVKAAKGASVALTDNQPQVLALLRRNAVENLSETQRVSWERAHFRGRVV